MPVKIASSTPDRIVLTQRPWFLGGFVGLVSAGALWSGLTDTTLDLAERLVAVTMGPGGLWAAWRFFPFVTVVLDRRAGTATHVARRVTGSTVTTLPLDRIDSIVAQQDCEGTPAERLVFVTGKDWLPLETGFSSIPRGPLVETVNAWLEGDRDPAP